MNQSTKTKSQQVSLLNGNKNINLPKLDRIIIKNNPSYKSPIYQQPRVEKKPTSIGDILKIEGKNNIKYNEPNNKGLEKDLKA